MFKFGVLLLLTALVAGALSAAIPDGMTPQLDGRIVGGNVATNNQFPYVVSIQRNGAHACGGVIYTSTVIVTAAHCLQAVTAANLRVRSGTLKWNSGGTLSTVSAFKNHEGYNPTTMINDIAVIRLTWSLSLGYEMKSIVLGLSSPYNGVSGVVAGWGTPRYGSYSVPNELQYADVYIVNNAQCSSSSYGYGKQIQSTMICANAPGKDACQFDSGGPLVVNNALAGIVSWGIGCANPLYPGVYTDIAVVRTWIVNNANSIY